MLNKFRDKALLEIVVFVSGAIVMIYEIIGSRILAPHIGTSTYVWTSLIGVILGALSLGYWLGGRVADRNPNLKILSAVLFFAAALVTFTMLIKEFVFFFGLTVSMRLEFKAVIASIILFAPASILLGFVTPYAVRLKMESVADAGKTVGRLYALSTIGSILGTFAAGFLLLPFVGSTRTLYLIVIVLFLLSLLVAPFKLTAKNLGLIILFPLAIGVNEFVGYVQSKNNNVRDFDTRYNRIRVIDAIQGGTGRPVRDLTTDPFSAQSSMYLDTKQTASRYISYYHLLRHFKPDFQKTLNIGGAGYSFPKDYLQKYPGKQIDVVEIDPQMTQIARDYFYLKEDKNLRIFHEDGRIFLNETTNKYDVIVIDAFNSFLSIPLQLTTIEAVRKMDDA
ncbi:MAG: fused MFS/spermidine synthase [Aridibacter sp.]